MDKAAVIREFLGWAETNKGVVLAWCDFEGACEMSPQSADELVDLFVASQEHGARLDAMRRLGAMSLVSPEWRPTPEAERGFAAMKEQAGDAALQAAKAGLLTVVQEQIHETLSRSAKTIDSVWHAALAEPPKC